MVVWFAASARGGVVDMILGHVLRFREMAEAIFVVVTCRKLDLR